MDPTRWLAVPATVIDCVMASPARAFIPLMIALAALGPAGHTNADEPFQVQLRILDHNVFGFNETFCNARAAGFGHIVANAQPAFDIVGLNEFYDITDGDIVTCSPDPLRNEISCTGRYEESGNFMLFHPDEGSPNGGVGLFTLGTICDSDEWAWTDQLTATIPDPLQGVIFARVAIPNTTITLDVYVLHTFSSSDDCLRCCHKEELQEAAAFIKAHSAHSGNPVILMGDFNIGGPPACCGNEGYEDITSVLGAPRDLWLEMNHCGRTSCGIPNAACDGEAENYCNRSCEECAGPTPAGDCLETGPGCDTVSCDPASLGDSCGYTRDGRQNEVGEPPPVPERIDYIFVVEHPALSSSAFRIQVDDARVANWTTMVQLPPDCFGCPYPNCQVPEECIFCEEGCQCIDCGCFECDPQAPEEVQVHVSDHLGVEATISIFGLPSVWVDAFQPAAGTGTSCDPFSSLEQALDAVPPGDRILLRRGLYPERLIIDRPCRVESVGGLAIIGF